MAQEVNGNGDRPVTQKELMSMALDYQEKLFEQVAKLSQEMNDNFTDIRESITELRIQVTGVTSAQAGELLTKSDSRATWQVTLMAAGMLVSITMSTLALVLH